MGEWKYLLLYNPVVWVTLFIFGSCFLSWLYWYCKRNFELKGSWKELDKSIHWRRK